MSERRPAPKKPSAPGGVAKPKFPGTPGGQPGDEFGDDNPGNTHGLGVDDHAFFHKDGHGPHAGRVVAVGVHGCQVEDHAGERHKVRWGRVLGVKSKAVVEAKVVDRGVAGSILEHKDGRRVFVSGDLPVPDQQTTLADLAKLEQRAGAPKGPKLSEREPFARAAGRERDMAKADHDCEGPALCGVCRARYEEPEPQLAKALGPGLEELERLAERLRAGPRSVRIDAGRLVPVLFLPRGR